MELRLDQIGQEFSRFRIIHPAAEARMLTSIRSQGQLSPVIVGEVAPGWQLVDGFKRYRAIAALQKERLSVSPLQRPLQSLKALLVTIKHTESPASELEEALVLQSLQREDGLKQEEIALLCNRHKSWVSRRIAMIERLGPEVVEQLRLGLVSLSVARELLRLPRGNQPEVLSAIQSGRLSSRQSSRFVDDYLRLQPSQRVAFLTDPWRTDPAIDAGIFSAPLQALIRQCERLGIQLTLRGCASLSVQQRRGLRGALSRVASQCGSYERLVHSTDAEVQ